MRQLALLLLFCCLAFGASRGVAQEAPAVDWRFGVVESYTAPNSARELGIGWTRVRFQWAEIQEGGPESWTPEVSDEQIAAELDAGREVVGLLIGIPAWARDENGLPQGLWLPHDDPDNAWATFVRQVSARYAGRIDRWVIWNEPDIDRTALAHTWDGSVDDFYQLQRVAYLAAKEANPEATIHLPAFTYWADFYDGREQYMARLLDRILEDPEAAANNHYFDVATSHLYFQPDQIYTLVDLFRSIMEERGLAKPIWLVETNAPPHDDPAWPVADWTLSVTEEEQAAFMGQAVVSALAAGAERIAVYKMRDTEGDRVANPEPFGLLRLDGSRRLAFTGLRVALQQMRNASLVERQRWDSLAQFRLEQPDRLTTVLFTRLPDAMEVELVAESSSALLIDMLGTTRVVEAQNGRFRLELPGALCTQTIADYCMIGGTTYYLVQPRPGGPWPEDPPPFLPQPPATPTAPPTATLATTATTSPSAMPSPSTTAAATLWPTASPAATITLTRTPEGRLAPATPDENVDNGDMARPATREPVALVGLLPLLAGLLFGGWLIWRGRR